MTSSELIIYDAPMCCSTGICGPEVDPALVRFAADLDWIARQGTHVRRYNLAQEPDAFVREETVRHVLQQEGEGALPLILLEGQALSRGRYPTREELSGWVGLDATAGGPSAPEAARDGCCGGGR